jgi:hypothetical protein
MILARNQFRYKLGAQGKLNLENEAKHLELRTKIIPSWNVSTLNQCRKLSCGAVVCKHFASYQGYPNYIWDLIRHAKGSTDNQYAHLQSQYNNFFLPTLYL